MRQDDHSEELDVVREDNGHEQPIRVVRRRLAHLRSVAYLDDCMGSTEKLEEDTLGLWQWKDLLGYSCQTFHGHLKRDAGCWPKR
jgi:hypothetical protein